jgi:hypothetical protein
MSGPETNYGMEKEDQDDRTDIITATEKVSPLITHNHLTGNPQTGQRETLWPRPQR